MTTERPTAKPIESTSYVGFRAAELAADMDARVTALSPGALAKRDLDRYYRLLALTLAQTVVRLQFTEGEASLLVDALNGTLTEPHTASLLWASVADAIDSDGLAEKWNVADGAAFVERLRRLTPFEALALADASERFWNRVAAGIEETQEERLRAVGLLRE